MKTLTQLFLSILVLVLGVCGCSRKKTLVANPLGDPPRVQAARNSGVHLVKGKILSVSEIDGLIGWVCEQDLELAEPQLKFYINNSPIATPGLIKERGEPSAQAECNNIGDSFRFTVPYADLQNFAGRSISVYAVPSNAPEILVLLANSNMHLIPSPTVASMTPPDSAPSGTYSTPGPAPAVPITHNNTSPVSPYSSGGISTPPHYTVTGISSPAEGGIVNGAGTVTVGDSLALVAQANRGYTFLNWSNCSNPNGVHCVFSPISSVSITANFARQICTPGEPPQSRPCTVSNGKGTGTEISTCAGDGLSRGPFGSCSSITCKYGYALNQNECVWPGPSDAAIPEQSKTASQTVSGKFEGIERGSQHFQGWVCQKDLRNSLKIKVYVGSSQDNKRFIGTYTANSPAGPVVAGFCSSIPASSRELGPHRFTIPLSVFSAADKGKKVFVYGIQHGTDKATLLPLRVHEAWSRIVP